MMSIVARFAAALIATVAVAEGYHAYLRKALTPPPAAEAFQAVHDRWVAERGRPAQRPAEQEDAFQDPAAAGIRSEIFTTDTEVIVTFSIPGLRSETVRVAVDGVRVVITCVASLSEEIEAAGGTARRAGLRQYELIMPLPAHADSARHRIVRDKGAFKIIFTKLDDPSLKS